MKKFALVIGVVSFCIFSGVFLAQAKEEENVSWDEKYKDKSSVYLLADRAIGVNDDWSSTNKRHFKIKIQKEEAKDRGEIPIYYNESREEVVDIEAYTITPDGKKHSYSKIQDFRVYEGYSMYSDCKMKVVTMPEVVVGSILEYKVTTLTKRLDIKDSFWYCSGFSADIPIKEINLKISFPKKLGIKYKDFNLEYKPAVEEREGVVTYSWHLKELEEDESEKYSPPPNMENVADCFEFSSIGSWKDISDWYYGLAQKNTVINSEIEEKVKELVEDKETTKDKIRAILEYLQSDFRYVSMSLGDHTLEPHPTDEVFRNKHGDCKDLSLLCKGMLKIAGIDSNIALFREEYSIADPWEDIPIPTLFNHVLLEVISEQENFYIDPLLDGYDIAEFPGGYQAGYTFIITEDGGRFSRFPVFDEKRMYSRMDSIVEIKEDGSAIFEAESLWDLDFSIDMRGRWKNMSQKIRDELLQMLDTRATSGGKMIERRWENIDEKYGCIKSFVKYERPNAYPVAGDIIIISSGGYNRGYDFSKEKRENPIFFPGNSLEKESTTYIIPEGFEVTYLPEDVDLNIGFFGFKRNYELDGGKLIVKELTRWSRKELPVERYKEVQNFFDQLPRKTDQRIIIKKVADKQEMDQAKQAWSK